MLCAKLYVSVCLLLICCVISVSAQQAAPAAANAVVPPVIKFSGVLSDVNNKPLTGTVGVTFSLYKDSQGGAPLWVETQNVTADKTGRFSVMLGSTTSRGMPADVFASGEARWLGVQAHGQAEQPRTVLMSVPYALKALDAETVGGKPASSFLLTPAAGGKSAAPGKLPPGTITGGGTADFIPRFTGTATIGNSNIFETVGGNVGIGTTAPAAKLDVKGTGDIRDTLTLFPKSTHPTLSIQGTAFEVSSTGLVTFISGQTFPGAGTVTSVGLSAPSSDFTVSGSPVTSSGTLGLGWTVAPTSADTANAIVKRDSTGSFTAGYITSTQGLVGESGTGAGVYGASTSGDGIHGVSSSGNGVYGYSNNFGVVGEASSSAYDGVYGLAHNGNAGVLGQNDATGYGVWGEVTGSGVDGVYGKSGNAYGSGVAGINSGSGDGVYAWSSGGYALYSYGANNYSAWFASPQNTYCSIWGGDLKCTGSKSAVVSVDSGSRKVALYALEAPENWFEDFGSGHLSNGEAVIHLEPTFAQTVNTGMDYHVFPVPNGDCKGLYVAEKTANGFVVRELGAGKSNIAFDYRIVARRKDYENIRLADETKAFTENKLKREAQMQGEHERTMAHPLAALSNGQHH